MKDENHIIISTDAEKTFDKIHPFMIGFLGTYEDMRSPLPIDTHYLQLLVQQQFLKYTCTLSTPKYGASKRPPRGRGQERLGHGLTMNPPRDGQPSQELLSEHGEFEAHIR